MIQARKYGKAPWAPIGVLVLASGCGETIEFWDAGTCTIALTGAIAETSGCIVTAAHYDMGNVTVISVVGVPSDAGYSLFSFGGNLGSEDIEGIHYELGNVTNAETVASVGQTSSWEQSLNGSLHPDQGTFLLAIDGVGLKITKGSDAGATWSYLSGSLDATLPPVVGTGATGTVTAHVTF